MPTLRVDGDETVQVRPGEEVTLEVNGASTTGYLWQLDVNPDAVEVLKHVVIPDEESFGGAGVERFTLRPLREGDATVCLKLKAPWDTEAAESHAVHVHSASGDRE